MAWLPTFRCFNNKLKSKYQREGMFLLQIKININTVKTTSLFVNCVRLNFWVVVKGWWEKGAKSLSKWRRHTIKRPPLFFSVGNKEGAEKRKWLLSKLLHLVAAILLLSFERSGRISISTKNPEDPCSSNYSVIFDGQHNAQYLSGRSCSVITMATVMKSSLITMM